MTFLAFLYWKSINNGVLLIDLLTLHPFLPHTHQTLRSFKVGICVYRNPVTPYNHIRLFTTIILKWFPDILELFVYRVALRP